MDTTLETRILNSIEAAASSCPEAAATLEVCRLELEVLKIGMQALTFANNQLKRALEAVSPKLIHSQDKDKDKDKDKPSFATVHDLKCELLDAVELQHKLCANPSFLITGAESHKMITLFSAVLIQLKLVNIQRGN